MRADGMTVVRSLVDTCGTLPLKRPALLVLALASSPDLADASVNAAALAALPVVARTAADLCKYAAFVQQTRGWGRRLRSAIADWYVGKPVKELTRQVLKGSNRTGWTHGDLLRLAPPKAPSAAHNVLFDWAVNGVLHRTRPMASDLAQLYAFERAKDASDSSEIVRIIEDERLTYEMLPQQWLNDADVWEALLFAMPYATLVRSLGRMTAVGLIAPESHAAALVVARLIDRGRITASKVQPMALLAALQTYKSGKAGSGKLRWKPVASVMDALDEAFYLAIGNVEPTGKRLYVAIDASASMQTSMIGGQPVLSVAAASAAMALILARTEPSCHITAFHEEIWHMSIGRAARSHRSSV